MSTFELNHFALLTRDMQATIDFYERYIGLELGECLEGGYGKFLYFPDSNQAVVHLLGMEAARKVDNAKPEGFQLYSPLDEHDNNVKNTNALDHIAFKTTKKDFDKLILKLKADDMPYRLGAELAPKNLQLWIIDPNGIKVEVGCFPEQEALV
jgi:catechol 2,3-dioxygenase-like lactoylglutathione lyase family enzyme